MNNTTDYTQKEQQCITVNNHDQTQNHLQNLQSGSRIIRNMPQINQEHQFDPDEESSQLIVQEDDANVAKKIKNDTEVEPSICALQSCFTQHEKIPKEGPYIHEEQKTFKTLCLKSNIVYMHSPTSKLFHSTKKDQQIIQSSQQKNKINHQKINIHKQNQSQKQEYEQKQQQIFEKEEEKTFKFCFGYLDKRDSCCLNVCKMISIILALPFILIWLFFKDLLCPCLKKCYNYIINICDKFWNLIIKCCGCICDAISDFIVYICEPICKLISRFCGFICDIIGTICDAICKCFDKSFNYLQKCCEYFYDKFGKCLNFFICAPMAICCHHIGKCLKACCHVIGNFSAIIMRCCEESYNKISKCIDYIICSPIGICFRFVGSCFTYIGQNCLNPCFTCIWEFICSICRIVSQMVSAVAQCFKKSILYFCTPVCKCLFAICRGIRDYLIIPVYQAIKKVFLFVAEVFKAIINQILSFLTAIYEALRKLTKRRKQK